ncbi:hypothetical protein M6D93_19300 [Jatrophihabitans telluris]|uniref:PBP domain-containing protein n=1 Tax=Jatrophihabitans telluris TaxID=2038343 RepID=A0ABY4R011_9ACTN|nr:hypothetical protein [Jatrophihabitans telluris]UQX88404.1 hypothetical protein M6D93_19300 [Jatrophihabitans telluris]
MIRQLRFRSAARLGTRPRRGVAFLAVLVLGAATTLSGDALAAGAGPAFTGSVTATRTHVVNGADKVVDSRHVTLSVDRTTNLQDQQVLQVTWSGAHPSANASADPNSTTADQAEYPMVLLQCRDTGSAATPVIDRVTPTTCWAPLGDERMQVNGGAGGADDVGNFPAWRLDRYAKAGDRQQYSGVPSPATATCPASGAVAQRAVPFVAADGTKYYGSGLNRSCGASPPEAATYFDAGTVSALPDNAAFVPTHADGTGNYAFNVRDAKTNASLGCSAKVACSLVAIPVMGISCNASLDNDDPNNPDDPGQPDRAATKCERGGDYPAGSAQSPGAVPQYAVSGRLWWSESNWRNRIVVPLSFAPGSEACDTLTSSAEPPAIYGSELLVQATTQWSTKLCLTPGASTFKHVQAAEPLSRTLVATGGVQGAFTSFAPSTPFGTPTVQAPVAATGFAISYTIDDKHGNPYTTLKLTPRLLAKLMTESYPGQDFVQRDYVYGSGTTAVKALANNPQNVTLDPEFQALNPNLPSAGNGASGVSSLLSISSQSDVMYALTSYLNADPEARAWLDGTPDPWGMTVNPNYKGVSLPVNTWPLADTWTVPSTAFPADLGRCETEVQPQPPYLPLIAGPSARLVDIAQSVQYAVPGDANACSNKRNEVDNTNYYTYTRAPKQSPGFRFVIGLTSLGDAQRYSLGTAALQTTSSVSSGAKYTDASGRSFAEPTSASLRAAFATLTRNTKTGVWDLGYDTLRTSAPTAYPGAMLVYADIPTKGLSSAAAASYASVLGYMIGPGQVSGTGVGQLPGGFLPITAANGLGAQAAYSTASIADVRAQQGLLPGQSRPPTGGSGGGTPSGAGSGSGTAMSGSGGSGGGTSGGGSSGLGGPAPAGSSAPTRTATTPTTASTSPAAPATAPALHSLGKTTGTSSHTYQGLLILLLALLLLGPVLVPATVLTMRWRGRR